VTQTEGVDLRFAHVSALSYIFGWCGFSGILGARQFRTQCQDAVKAVR
jgi:ABC-type microcin C transport system permease subunit YejE